MTAVAAHLRTSTLISVVISMVISAAFFLLVFGSKAQLTLFAPDGLALDFIPQTLAAAFMSALVPSLQTRSKILVGTLPGQASSTKAIVVRSVILALASLIGAAVATGLLWLAQVQALSWSEAFGMKIVYGGLLGLIITPIALRAILPKG